MSIRHLVRAFALGFAAILATPLLAQEAADEPYDWLFRGATVLDGSGGEPFQADVAVLLDEIVAIGDLENAQASKVVDARGKVLAPGFLDLHSHADGALGGPSIQARGAPNLVTQGITTVVFGADGRNRSWPLEKEIADYLDPGVALNIVPMVGHNTIRAKVLGQDFRRVATDVEIEEMKTLLREGMQAGAWGLGAGLEYDPGRYSETQELIELARVVAEFDGFYFAHQRSQSQMPRWQVPSEVRGTPVDGSMALDETIRLARETGIRVVGSHIKAKGKSSWGRAAKDIARIDSARKQGLKVYLDQYPYETYEGGATTMFPAWTMRGRSIGPFRAHVRELWTDPDSQEKLRKDLEFRLDLNGGADRLIVVAAEDSELRGETLAAIAERAGRDAIEQLVHFAIDSGPRYPEGVLLRNLGMSAADVETYMQQDYCATCTDAGVMMTSSYPATHPRFYGSFPRKIAVYVREKELISLPFAIRSMTGLAAEIIGLKDRGFVRVGMKADLVLFDPDAIRDRATILDPHQPSEGLDYVLVNGEAVLKDGALNERLPGRVLDNRDR